MLPKFLLVSLFSFVISATIFTHSYSQCLEHQRSLLLELKNELVFDSSLSTKLVRWNRTGECCEWQGVECDGAGHVVSLQLEDESISGGIGDSSSLFRLERLEKLNLAGNDFNYSIPIPRGIMNLTCLTHLNLSNACFRGQVPVELSFLRRLISLDISSYSLSLKHPNLEMLIQNMTELRELYLDGVDIISSDERRRWSHIISSHLPHLTSLSLTHCSLSGPLAKSFWQLRSLSILRLDGNDLSTTNLDLFASFTNLTTLSLAECGLIGSFPNMMIFRIPTLQNLDLSGNAKLGGSIPSFAQAGSLKSIRLGDTNFSGLVPSSISNLKSLMEIHLAYSKFTGSIPSTFANLTELVYIDLSYNFFSGSLSSMMFGGLFGLVSLDLSYNSFTGNIPPVLFGLPSLLELKLDNNQFTRLGEEFLIVNVSKMVDLDLSSNRLEGPIPDYLFQLHSLETLLLNENFFSGSFQLEKIQSLANLTDFRLSDNKLSVKASSNSSSVAYGLLKLQKLYLASCNMHDFPDFIKHSDNMRYLDLSNNRISGGIPSWIWGAQLMYLDLSRNFLTDVQKPYRIPASLGWLDMHSNQLKGELHLLIPPTIGNLAPKLYALILANNSFSGSVPTFLCTAPNLDVLDLSVNRLSGSIPPCLLVNSSILKLGGNNISGRIPDTFPLDCHLEYFDINNNTIQGKIPKSLESCRWLQFMNVGNNIINDTFPCMLSWKLRVLVLHSNRFHGEVSCNNSWPILQVLDISLNNFSGSLKSINFSSWRGMIVDSKEERSSHSYIAYTTLRGFTVTLNLKGNEMDLEKIWRDFGTIDFSCNNFQGEIPNSIGDLVLLHHLNFSHNALNGSMPNSFGQLRKLESLDLSRNQLRGAIPVELTELTFLSFLNLSYNKLVGEIPNGRQLQTFSADSFVGNLGLCGFNLNKSCSDTAHNNSSPRKDEDEDMEEKREIEWEYVSTVLGYIVGLGSFAWLLIFCRRFRVKYFGKIDEVVEKIFDARDKRQRRRSHARKEVMMRNRARRQ